MLFCCFKFLNRVSFIIHLSSRAKTVNSLDKIKNQQMLQAYQRRLGLQRYQTEKGVKRDFIFLYIFKPFFKSLLYDVCKAFTFTCKMIPFVHVFLVLVEAATTIRCKRDLFASSFSLSHHNSIFH